MNGDSVVNVNLMFFKILKCKIRHDSPLDAQLTRSLYRKT